MERSGKTSPVEPQNEILRELVNLEVKKIVRKKKEKKRKERLKTIEEHSAPETNALDALGDPEFSHPV